MNDKSDILSRLPWHRLTREQQRTVAEHAAIHGIQKTAIDLAVSTTAVRRACAMCGIPPKQIAPENKERRIKAALSLLRGLKLKPEDLIS